MTLGYPIASIQVVLWETTNWLTLMPDIAVLAIEEVVKEPVVKEADEARRISALMEDLGVGCIADTFWNMRDCLIFVGHLPLTLMLSNMYITLLEKGKEVYPGSRGMRCIFFSLCPIHGWTLCTQTRIFVQHFAGKIFMNLGQVLQLGDGLGVSLCGLRGWGWGMSGNGHVLVMIWGKTFFGGGLSLYMDIRLHDDYTLLFIANDRQYPSKHSIIWLLCYALGKETATVWSRWTKLIATRWDLLLLMHRYL